MKRIGPLLIAGILALAGTALLAQSPSFPPVRESFAVPQPTGDGDWYGTWYHESRERQMAIWIRPGTPDPEIRIRYFRLGGGEQFTTEWNAKVDYQSKDGAPGHFALGLTSASADRMTATWTWSLEYTDSARLDNGDLSIYRSGDGRMLVLLFDNFERKIRRGPYWESGGTSHALTFHKASKRVVAWDELPF